jgi:hypothetical protein
MMDQIDRWPHKWFGVWREYGPAYERCPSVHEFVCPAVARPYDHQRLRDYLTRGLVVASTSRSNFPSPFSGERIGGSVSFRTDGTWIWRDDLPDYVQHHDVALPSGFLKHIVENNYVLPVVDPGAIAGLEWPPVA